LTKQRRIVDLVTNFSSCSSEQVVQADKRARQQNASKLAITETDRLTGIQTDRQRTYDGQADD